MLGAEDLFTADLEALLYGLKLGLEHVIFLAELHDPLFQYHVIKAPLFTRTFSRLIVPPATVPVAVILFVVGDELALLALGKELLAQVIIRAVLVLLHWRGLPVAVVLGALWTQTRRVMGSRSLGLRGLGLLLLVCVMVVVLHRVMLGLRGVLLLLLMMMVVVGMMLGLVLLLLLLMVMLLLLLLLVVQHMGVRIDRSVKIVAVVGHCVRRRHRAVQASGLTVNR